uniref:NADH dehydrogenase subunit 3 n=1 Tax=Stenamma expolitum TaxID=625355 RepID=UPI001FCDD0FF|nr:NADH dehydrogenase subunit 3 [Stenamma expolitum]UNZ99546.1 NADH dehydrogenase subunit 3 [Stenamma expolitum]
MLQLLMFLTLIMFISSLLMLLNIIISKKMKYNREKNSPFECGFDPFSSHHMPFSIQFFMISMIFLIFDIEITLLMPMIQMTTNFSFKMISTSLIFLMFLIYGLYIEYLEKSIDWKM